MTVERKPDCCIARARASVCLVDGREVRARRAREEFLRCEHMLTMWLSMVVLVGGLMSQKYVGDPLEGGHMNGRTI